MKSLVAIVAVAAFTFGLPLDGFAADMPAAPTGAAPDKVAGDAKTIPMHSRADTIDAKARFFITKRKDGIEVKNILTATTEVKQGEAVAKFEDIKVGDYVSGSRKKVSPTEYTVVKITKFGPK